MCPQCAKVSRGCGLNVDQNMFLNIMFLHVPMVRHLNRCQCKERTKSMPITLTRRTAIAHVRRRARRFGCIKTRQRAAGTGRTDEGKACDRSKQAANFNSPGSESPSYTTACRRCPSRCEAIRSLYRVASRNRPEAGRHIQNLWRIDRRPECRNHPRPAYRASLAPRLVGFRPLLGRPLRAQAQRHSHPAHPRPHRLP